MLVQCLCSGTICRKSPVTGRDLAFTLRYTCAECKRRVPWCFGAADDRPELCDDCWGKSHDKSTASLDTVFLPAIV